VLPALLGAIMVLAPADGHSAYLQQCAACHGVDLRGGPNAPNIRGVGPADVDFWVGTGRMPAAVPWIEVGHLRPRLSQATIDALVAYVVSVQPGGPPIPIVVTNGNATHGMTLFRENCMHCHGATGSGAAIGDRQWAPALERATIVQVAEAIRVGPGEMPAFGEAQLTRADVDDLATYISRKRAAGGPHGLPEPAGGPVPEGLLGWLAAGALAMLAYAFSTTRKESSS
jgi:ubiquinol-cytochrome c reductase cytochrome c subunit